MDKHERLLKEKFPHAEEDLLFRSNRKESWSLFRTKTGGVTIYYHDSDDFYIISGKQARFYSLEEIADNWNPIKKEISL